MTFHTDFINSLNDDEHSLLLAVINNNKPVHYKVQHSIAEVVLAKLKKVPLNEDGDLIRKSILQKYGEEFDFQEAL